MPGAFQRNRRGARPRQPTWLVAAAAGGPLVLGVVLGWLADLSLPSALLLMAEPVLFAAGVYAAVVLALGGRLRTAMALVVGLFLGGAATRMPAEPRSPAQEATGLAETLRRCARFPETGRGRVRIASWSLAPDPGGTLDLVPLQRMRPDVVVLLGTHTDGAARALAEATGGNVRFAPPTPDRQGVSIITRGQFQQCAGDDLWALPLATGAEPAGHLTVAFPHVDGVGQLPLVVVQLDGMGRPARWPSWPARLASGGDRIAAMVDALDASHTVVIGNFGAPSTFRHLAGRLEGVDLTEAPVPPTWPQRAGPLPWMPTHALQRAWSGPGWSAGRAWGVRMGRQATQPLVIEFEPTSMQAGR